MEFFKGIGNKISQTSQEAIKKTKEIADTTKLNSEISAEEKKINVYYQNIGKLYFEKYADNSDNEFEDILANIRNSFEKIEAAKEEIRKLKGKRNCPNCGAELDVEILFCSMCGFKLPPLENKEEQTQLSEQKSSQPAKFCANCGEKLEEDAAFCPFCGTKA